MDYLRSAYSGDIYSFDGETVVTARINWYEAQWYAKPLGFRHQYASQNWTRPTAYNQQIGEVITKHPGWSNGARPPGIVYGRYCGDESLWTGELQRLDMPEPSNPFGQPLCCGDIAALFLVGTSPASASRSWVGSGSLALRGSSSGNARRSYSAAGALALAGTSPASSRRSYSAAGALALAGTSPASARRTYASSGTIALKGTSEAAAVRSWVSSGALQLTGTSPADAVREWESDGALQLTGTSPNSGGGTPTPTYTGCSVCTVTFHQWKITVAGATGQFVGMNGTSILSLISGCHWGVTAGTVAWNFQNNLATWRLLFGDSLYGSSAVYTVTPRSCTASNTVAYVSSVGTGTSPATITVVPYS